MKHILFILTGLVITVMGMGFLWTQAHSADSNMTGVLGPVFQQPVYNWRVCADLGVGPSPGTNLRRQRFRL